MSADRLERVQAIVERAVRIAPDLRAAFIAHACDADAAMQAEVQSLLPHYLKMLEFEPPAIGPAVGLPGTSTFDRISRAASDEPEAEVMPPFNLGEYRVTDIVGRGGMGVVYRARRGMGGAPVAIKLLRRAVASAESRRRFAFEVEILRRLEHPGIARLLHTGTQGTGQHERPYFVMELVSGPPLTRYAEAGGLDTRARIELLIEVCAALDYAHQRGIVHCDLKPANVLVVDGASPSARPQPKILDFGIARIAALDSQYLPDAQGGFAGTPEYASPEQLTGQRVELQPTCDVYSLALIACELLTGARPQRVNGRMRVDFRGVRMFPSKGGHAQADRRCRRELAAILAAALQTLPAARLQSAGAVGIALTKLLRQFPPATTRWGAVGSRIRSYFSPAEEDRPNPLEGPLKIIVRSRIAAAIRGKSQDSAADDKPGASQPDA